MKMITKQLKEKLLKADKKNKNTPLEDQEIIVKYFHPGRYTFYALSAREYEDDLIMYGYVLSPDNPDYDEYGPVSLNELKSIPLMERDLYFKNHIMKEVIEKKGAIL